MATTATEPIIIEEPQLDEKQTQAQKEALQTADKAKLLKVENQESYLAASTLLEAVKSRMKFIQELWKPMKSKTYQAWQAVCEQESTIVKPLKEAETYLKDQIGDYLLAEDQKRQAEQERIQRELEAQQRAQEEEQRLQMAIELEEGGNREAATQVLDAPIETTAATVVLPPATPKFNGQSARKTYEVQAVDIKRLAKAVAEGKAPIMALQPNLSWLTKQANQMQDLFNIPGVTVKPKMGITVRTKK